MIINLLELLDSNEGMYLYTIIVIPYLWYVYCMYSLQKYYGAMKLCFLIKERKVLWFELLYVYYNIYTFRQEQGYLASKNFARNIFKCVYLSLFIIRKLFLKSESLLLFKLNQLMVPIGKKPAPSITCETFPCKMSLCRSYNYFLCPPIVRRKYKKI